MPASVKPMEKLAFSCLGDEAIKAALKGKSQVIAVGIETHVCVFQTVRDLEELGVRTFVPRDAVLSRSEGNRTAGLEVMAQLGSTIGSTELFLFDLTKTAGTDEFKAVSRLVK
jgi:nicotinamidase-related amidase